MLAEIGHSRPPFALRDQHDLNATPLEDDVIGDPVLLVFDRNPVDGRADKSVALLRNLADLHDRLDKLVINIFVISRRSVSANRTLAETQDIPFRLLADEDGSVFDLYGINMPVTGANTPADPAMAVLDSNGRVVDIFEDMPPASQADRALNVLLKLNKERPRGSLGAHPPVLVLPNAMDPNICKQLIDTWHNPVPLWEGDGKNSIGLNIEKGDVKVRNAAYGNCTQYVVRDAALSAELDGKVLRRVVPEIEKAFGYSPSKREEYRIACYDVADGGSLPAHRDNPTGETRHRRFTVSINLNNEDFDGGELAFREFSDHHYDIEAGTAVVWSCSVLHEVMPISAGRRFILGTHLFG